MSEPDQDTLRQTAEQIADLWSHRGYAFVEDDQLDGLATTLRAFLCVARIPFNDAETADLATP
ncbi:hypothetical protein FB565_000325 [Actinoplanes lutulentus]|uniref:Uncharacterized protein n=1 Tax=Actinoplanes lutulentus TaxID=1287878 RepID=A0A327ZJC5_9ACTN|nr:hypothetical protein [Actinoplanes lutulentus]MBB2940621.1 hypothetical protein [Actinoplanes lutulentus]RAK42932.1 hypothetical protein B0I29_10162 [Actinoplanes lutulentus]